MNKKASLNLSIQAIVILVMAMAVLGLGLGFIRTLIGQGQGQFETAIDNAQLENPASASQPVTVDRNVEVKQGGSAKIRFGFYNNGDTQTTSWTPSLEGTTCIANFELETGAQDVNIGEAKGYEGLLTMKTSGTTLGPGDQTICALTFTGAGSKQFYVTVTS